MPNPMSDPVHISNLSPNSELTISLTLSLDIATSHFLVGTFVIVPDFGCSR